MRLRSIAFVCAAAFPFSLCHAATEGPTKTTASYSDSSAVSPADSALPETPETATESSSRRAGFAAAGGGGQDVYRTHPFSAVGVAVKIGTGGIGFDVAVPVARKVNVRGGFSVFNYTGHFTEDGIASNGTINLRNANASLDFFPFGGGFRLSPGVLFYNGDKVSATANVPGGQSFTLNDVSYTSSVVDPVNGSFNVGLGKKAAPSFTLGWGNIVPRSGKHWSFPVEIGAAYVDYPTVALSLQGTACGPDGCAPVQADPMTQANIQNEQTKLRNDIAPLRFLPIVSIGLSFKF